ncbi:hypothetical protein LSAT2_021399 [Lamellibrachia satsuma]|nr:hypothetical protein LSAT2_021399 [Lamellibrachia satsuma]
MYSHLIGVNQVSHGIAPRTLFSLERKHQFQGRLRHKSDATRSANEREILLGKSKQEHSALKDVSHEGTAPAGYLSCGSYRGVYQDEKPDF